MTGLPRRRPGRQSAEAVAKFEAEKREFCDLIRQIASTLDFKVSARGWGYIFENRGVITKDDLDACQSFINSCRKSGDLPLDICSADEARSFSNVERISDASASEYARGVVRYVERAHCGYRPISVWENQPYYVQIMVEKIDLRSLFESVCEEFSVPVANAKGWSDINSRADLMRRFAEHEAYGCRPVLLYCGDHDPAGLNISEYLRSNLEELSRATGWSPDNLIIDRFGLNADFIEDNGLVWIDNLITGSGERLDDPRHPDHRKPYVQNYIQRFGVRKVEANALVVQPEAGRELCRQAILKYFDTDALDEYREAIDSAQREVQSEIRKALVDMEGGE
jgi:hypothetical protein